LEDLIIGGRMLTRAFLIVTFFAMTSQAADDSAGVVATARVAVDKAGTAIANYGSSVSSYYERVFGGRLEAGFTRVDAAISGLTGSREDFERATKYREGIWKMRQEEGEKARKALEAANTAAGDAARATGSAVAQAATKTMDAAQTANLIRQLSNGNTLTWDMNKLWGQYNNINETVRVIEKELDNSVLNAYLQQKVARVLSSDNLCTAAKSCAANNGKNKATFNMEDMKDIFPHADKDLRKASGTKAAPQQSGTR
jgi:hypothetical protein